MCQWEPCNPDRGSIRGKAYWQNGTNHSVNWPLWMCNLSSNSGKRIPGQHQATSHQRHLQTFGNIGLTDHRL